MSGTGPEQLPGGLLDRLVATGSAGSLTSTRKLAAVGAYAAAWRALHGLPTTDPAVAAWRRFVWHGCWLALPDGVARPGPEVGVRLAEMPAAPKLGDAARAEEWIIGRLLTGIRDRRDLLSPARLLVPAVTASYPGLATDQFQGAVEDLVEAGERAADRPDLVGHLHLLGADLAARAGDKQAVAEYLRVATTWLLAARDMPGLAAAALLTGDLSAAPLTSPLSWNCVLATVSTSSGNALPDPVEEWEFLGSTVQMTEAEGAYAEAEARYTKAECPAGLAAVAMRRGFLAIVAGEPGRAVGLIERARAGFEAAGRPLDLAIANTHLALAAIADDRLAADFRLADSVVQARHMIGHAPALGLGLLCVRIGRYWTSREPERAQAAFGLAGRILAGLDEPVLRAQTLTDLAAIATELGDVSGARNALREALTAEPVPSADRADPFDPDQIRRAMLDMRLYNIACRAGDVQGMELAGQAMSAMFDILRACMDRFDLPQRLIATELLARFDPNEPRLIVLLYRIRDAQEEGDTRRAAELLVQARAVLDEMPAREHHYLEALLKCVEGDNAGASAAFERYVERAVSTSDSPGAETVRMYHEQALAFQLNVGVRDRARAHYDALVAAGAGDDPGWRLLGFVGRPLELEGDLEAAAATMDRALAQVESVRATLRRDELKQSFFTDVDVQTNYLAAARIALRLAERQDGETRWHAAAFDYAERGRARALRDLIMGNTARTDLPTELLARWRAACATAALAQDRLDRAEQRGEVGPEPVRLNAALSKLRAVESELQNVNPRFGVAVNPQAEVGDLKDVANALPAGAALIQFVVDRTDLLAWAVTRDGMVPTHRRSGPNEIAGLVAAVVNACAAGGEGYLEPAARLSTVLLDPIRAPLRDATELFVVPGGALLRLPFTVLPWNGSTLGEVLPITVLPSASALCAGGDRADRSGRPLVVGDPAGMTYGEAALRPLPGARAEAAYIAGLLPGANLLSGEDATADRVRALLPEAPVVHLATHGIADADSPLGSAVLLASGESLTAADLLGAQLGADLVVVSACHTGTGRPMRGDELLGLARGLLVVGARATVVSLWAVDDRSAALLMCEFHRQRHKGLSDQDALRRAAHWLRTLDPEASDAAYEQLLASGEAPQGSTRTLRDLGPSSATEAPHTNPHHWAPFVLISSGG